MAGPGGESCGGCRFWVRHEDEAPELPEGTCQRMPPALLDDQLSDDARRGQGMYRGIWPDTDADDWCGEYRPREAKPDEPTDATAELTADERNWLKLVARIYWGKGGPPPIRLVPELLGVLRGRERDALNVTYGLGEEPLLTKDAAKRLGVTQTRYRSILTEGIDRMIKAYDALRGYREVK